MISAAESSLLAIRIELIEKLLKSVAPNERTVHPLWAYEKVCRLVECRV